MTQQTSFAELVRMRREALSMTQSVLADAAGLTDRTVQRVERGESPSPETVMALCSVLGIAQTTAHAALRQSPPTRPADVEPRIAASAAPAALPPAHGPEAEADRSLAIAKLVRTQGHFEVITGPDLTAYARDLVTERDLARQGMTWASGGCEEQVIAEAGRRSARKPLRKVMEWFIDNGMDPVATVLIAGVICVALGAAAIIVAVDSLNEFYHYRFEGAQMVFLFMLLGMILWFVTLVTPTGLERAAAQLSEHWVAGIGREAVTISKVRTNGVTTILARDVVRCGIEQTGRHLSWTYTTFDGKSRRLDYLPDVPQVRAAFERFAQAVADLSNATESLSPIPA